MSDIVDWTRIESALQQQVAMDTLCNGFSEQMENCKLVPCFPVTSTGDGFVAVFPLEDVAAVLAACDKLRVGFAIRLAIADGFVFSASNSLFRDHYVGPAFVATRRILDGIASKKGGTLIAENLWQRSRTFLSDLRPRVCAHGDVVDKHGISHRVVELFPTIATVPQPAQLPKTLGEYSRATESPVISSLNKVLGSRFSAIDGLILFWITQDDGLKAGQVRVENPWDPTSTDSIAKLPKITEPLLIESASAHLDAATTECKGENRPKVWIKQITTPLVDRPTLDILAGRTDFLTVKALELAHEDRSLTRLYEERRLNVVEDLPGLVGAVTAIVTSDRQLILAQRKGTEVKFAGGAWSPSFEEQWDPREESLPHETVLRGLREEFHIDRDHGVNIHSEHVLLLAAGREWGAFYNSVLVYLVDLPVIAQRVLDLWADHPGPRDKNEHTAVAAIPLDKNLNYLKGLVTLPRKGRLLADDLQTAASGVVGAPTDGLLHPTHGRARILLTLFAKKLL